ncbi:hypothetical protein [Frankia sp. CiP3]|uniref:hypothetical protein n=1 Tax=Frankia sp. CiP3 TaxID=2880971 RepID=UPI001EF5C503|nr:hypothetical protein [Frankia sp. CiP3]
MALVVARASVEGGKGRLIGDLAADDVQGSLEGEPVRVDPVGVGGLDHESPDRVVGEEESPELLADHLRGFGAQSRSGREELSFDLFEGQLVFPALLVDGSEFESRGVGRVEDGRDERECPRNGVTPSASGPFPQAKAPLLVVTGKSSDSPVVNRPRARWRAVRLRGSSRARFQEVSR